MGTPTQLEYGQVMTYLTEHKIEEGKWMCLVAAPWWSYWCNYAALTEQDLEKLPERLALGLGKPTVDNKNSSIASVGFNTIAEGNKAEWNAVGISRPPHSGGEGVGNGSTAGGVGAQAMAEYVGEGGKERVVLPTMLAQRPHEMDNSTLQVACPMYHRAGCSGWYSSFQNTTACRAARSICISAYGCIAVVLVCECILKEKRHQSLLTKLLLL